MTRRTSLRTARLISAAVLLGSFVSACNQVESPGTVVRSDALTLAVTLDPEAARAGKNALYLDIHTADGEPVLGAEVSTKVIMHAMGGMPAMGGTASVTEETAGRYRADFDLDLHFAAEMQRVAELDADPLEIDRWLGIASIEGLANRDLWKHQKAVKAIAKQLAADATDVRGLVWRGNAYFFLVGGLEQAKADYEAALALEPGPELAATARRNLELLTTTRRP